LRSPMRHQQASLRALREEPSQAGSRWQQPAASLEALAVECCHDRRAVPPRELPHHRRRSVPRCRPNPQPQSPTSEMIIPPDRFRWRDPLARLPVQARSMPSRGTKEGLVGRISRPRPKPPGIPKPRPQPKPKNGEQRRTA
jgi:hypothetical protein